MFLSSLAQRRNGLLAAELFHEQIHRKVMQPDIHWKQVQ
jgi:hypothetical protein